MEEFKATKAPAHVKDPRVDRPSRKSTPSTTSRHSQEPGYSHSRSRSRSPYRAPRGEKRQMADDHYDYGRRDGRQHKARYEPEYRRRPVSYADIDRDDNTAFETSRGRDDRYHSGSHDSYSHRDRNRSRSPYRHPKGPDSRGGDGSNGKRQRNDLDNREYAKSIRLFQGRGLGERERALKDQSTNGHTKNDTQTHEHNSSTRYFSVHPFGVSQFTKNRDRNDNAVNGNGRTKTETTVAEEEPEPMDEEARIEARRKQREAIKAKYKNSNVSAPLLVQALHIGTESGSATPKVQTPRVDISAATNDRTGQSNIPLMYINLLTVQIASPNITSPDTPNPASMPGSPLITNELTNNIQIDASPAIADEPSAADYDPMMDMHEDRARKEEERTRHAEQPAADYDEMQMSDRRDILLPGTSGKDPKEADMFADDDDDFDMFSDGPIKHPTASKAVQVPRGKVLAAGLLDNWDDPEGYYKIIGGELLDNRYLVKEQLGKGVFAGVVRGVDNETGKFVAIKIIRNNDIMRKAGLKEIEILETLNEADPTDSRHVVRLLRHFMHKNHLCMVFENLHQNLRSLIKTFGRTVGLPLNVVRSYAIQMLKGLSLLKKCNILHADLKPDNILADEAGNKIKIADLGSASDIQENEITPYLVSRFYRAPEIMLGILPDFPIDMWSIACTLFELFTDQMLFKGNSNNQMLKSIMECRGKISKKVIKRGSQDLRETYWDYHLEKFNSLEKDPVTERVTVRQINISSSPIVGKDIKSRISTAAKKQKITAPAVLKEVDQFRDLLEKCLRLDPDERLTPVQALQHPFFQTNKKIGK
jgi:serine/threonine-protein kinase PRP4